MRSSAFTANTNATAAAMNLLRSDASGAGQCLAHQQGTPGMTVHVEPGTFFIGPTRVTYAGGNTGTFTAPSTHPRIDLITIDSSGTLGTVTGTEASSPTAPTYPTDKFVVAEVYHVVGESVIYDNENQTGGQGYLTDTRRFLASPGVKMEDLIAMGWQGDTSGTHVYTSGPRWEMHVIGLQMTVGTVSPAASGRARPVLGIGGAWATTAAEVSTYSDGQTRHDEEHCMVAFIPPNTDYRLYIGNVTGSATVGVTYWWRYTL